MRLPGTPEEIRGWTTAARVFMDEFTAAMDDVLAEGKRPRRRRWWRRSAQPGASYDEIRLAGRKRIDTAVSTYRPVGEEIDARLAARMAARDRPERSRKERAELRFPRWFTAWKCRQMMLDRPLSDRRTARQIAAAGETPTSWPAGLTTVVGDVDAWWAGVRAAVRNEQARVAAVAAVVDAFMATAEALELAGRPGITADHSARVRVRGWPVTLEWPDVPGVALAPPPGIPPKNVWHESLRLRPQGFMVTVEREGTGPEDYRVSVLAGESVGLTRHKRPAWRHMSIRDYVESHVLWHTETVYPWDSELFSNAAVRICEHVDPDVYVPYTEAVARHVVETFRALRDEAIR
ncbi:hypothetical protein [Kibdelosporangium phytohabitans]|uniref:Uncharacterized protein n=1 Tax=Kibdelosporangium phytohabitans TaxID=860235 RepID=A0A0N9HX80_9PSEU|nr:hypothetical protein [Kibdelosporangium phytohabitans]ALG10012.1 hypothetical protein AOZ06_26715 [Kibdelosporangium phytohabitans]MBE1468561.1 hypothetical protein [Kibdelosporangium phytohabitans]